MKDNKLIELAAMAVGPKVVRKVECSGGFELVELSSGLSWNPLEDDGAALRLAVRLNIEFACFDDSQKVNAGVWSEDSKPYDCMTPYNGDKQAATRRAIVRAAAEIGKSMQP